MTLASSMQTSKAYSCYFFYGLDKLTDIMTFKDNILMSSAGEPLISDFGLSHMMSATQTLMASNNSDGGLKGTVRWMAIELFDIEEGEAGHSKASDMWAYGMTVYVSHGAFAFKRRSLIFSSQQ